MKILNKQFWINNLWHGENSRERNRARHFEGIPFSQKELLTSLVMPDVLKEWGIDISHWNLPPVNLKRMVDLYGMDFVIIKGCDGSVNTRYFPEHVQAAKEAGIPFSMYVWLYPANRVSISVQVNAWYARAQQYKPEHVFVDAEWTIYAGQIANPNATDLKSALDMYQVKSEYRPIVYTAKGYADTYLKGFDWSREKLWVANYGVSIPALPAGAADYVLHQFTSTLDGRALDPNGNAELDGNYNHGLNIGGTQPPPTNGGSMARYKVTTEKTNMSLRNDHNTGATKVGSIPNAQTKLDADIIWTAPENKFNSDGVQINKVGDEWAHLVTPNSWIAITHLGIVYCSYVDTAPPVEPPPPTGNKTVTIIVDVEGYKPKTFTGELEAE